MPDFDGIQKHAEALLDYVQTGAYPDSEDVISGDLPSATLPDILRVLKEARVDLEVWPKSLLLSHYGIAHDK